MQSWAKLRSREHDEKIRNMHSALMRRTTMIYQSWAKEQVAAAGTPAFFGLLACPPSSAWSACRGLNASLG